MFHSSSSSFVKLPQEEKGLLINGDIGGICRQQRKKKKKKKEQLKKKAEERIFMLSGRCRVKGLRGC